MRVLRHCYLAIVIAAMGCQQSTPPQPSPAPAPVAEVAPQPAAPEVPPPDPAVRRMELLNTVQTHLAAGELAKAKSVLETLTSEPGERGEEETNRFATLTADLQKAEAALAAEARAVALAEARKLLADGDLEGATRSADAVLNAAPAEEERLAAGEVKKQVEEQRKARLRLKTAMRLLASERRGDVRAAQEQLFAEAGAAWPLVVEATQSDQPVLAANALEMLRTFNQPERAIPVILAVLTKPQQEAVWPAAIKELQKLSQPGAGAPLLELAVSSEDEKVRMAALSALAGVVDPPPETLLVLLPLIYQDGPSLAPAISAMHHAVDVHQQLDLATLRGIGGEPTAEQAKMLTGLAPRLVALAGESSQASKSPVAEQALKLGIATRVIEHTPLAEVKVARHSGEEETGPANAVLDGDWTSAKPEKSWRYPLSGQAYIVLDLGRDVTVTGVRLWNHNQPGAMHRGWKDVDVYVDSRPALLAPVASGQLPVAPPTADSSDYHSTILVPFVRGRFVKLQPRSYWRADAVSGLAEVQVLGY